MGALYEIIGAIYSLGRIPRCKVSMLKHVKPGDRVLVAGVGHGTEAVAAARMGALVTAVDLSPTMIKQLQKKIARSGLDTSGLDTSGSNGSSPSPPPIQMINDNILNVTDPDGYDMVIANFFLNVFPRELMTEIFHHMTGLVKPGGCMVIGDFTLPAAGGWVFRVFQNIYWYIAAIFFWITADNAVHQVYDYPEMLKSKGFDIPEITYFNIFGIKSYWSILGKKPKP